MNASREGEDDGGLEEPDERASQQPADEQRHPGHRDPARVVEVARRFLVGARDAVAGFVVSL